MEYREQLIAFAEADAADELDDAVESGEARAIARNLHAAIRMQEVLWAWRGDGSDELEELRWYEPEDFFWRLLELGSHWIEEDWKTDAYVVAAVDRFMVASPQQQADVYHILRGGYEANEEPGALALATQDRERLIANWAFHRANGPPEFVLTGFS